MLISSAFYKFERNKKVLTKVSRSHRKEILGLIKNEEILIFKLRNYGYGLEILDVKKLKP